MRPTVTKGRSGVCSPANINSPNQVVVAGHKSAVEYAVTEIVHRPDQINLARVSESIGYSPKHFISIFRQQVGIAPKAYLKIIRFQKAISEIEQRKQANWANISQDCGFYDQAHIINDFKFFSGFTPGEYVRRKNDVVNYVPVG